MLSIINSICAINPNALGPSIACPFVGGNGYQGIAIFAYNSATLTYTATGTYSTSTNVVGAITYSLVSFTGSGTILFNGSGVTVYYLLVAGGGGGGVNAGGGGGAGGLLQSNFTTTSNSSTTTYTITIGSGGNGSYAVSSGSNTGNIQAQNGGNSTITTSGSTICKFNSNWRRWWW